MVSIPLFNILKITKASLAPSPVLDTLGIRDVDEVQMTRFYPDVEAVSIEIRLPGNAHFPAMEVTRKGEIWISDPFGLKIVPEVANPDVPVFG